MFLMCKPNVSELNSQCHARAVAFILYCFAKKTKIRTKAVPSIYPRDTDSMSQHVGQPVNLLFYSLAVSKQVCRVQIMLAHVSLPSYTMIHVKCLRDFLYCLRVLTKKVSWFAASKLQQAVRWRWKCWDRRSEFIYFYFVEPFASLGL